MNSSPAWVYRMLGEPRLSGPGRPDWRLERKLAACLAYLTLEGPTYRSRLAGLLWPDSLEATARNNLSQLLRRLRTTAELGQAGMADPVELPSGLQVDALTARTLYAQGRYAELLAFEGDLLQGLSYDDCPDLDDWVLAERERWSEWRSEALRAESTRLERAGEYDAAQKWVRQLLALDPVSEDAWRRLMRLQYLRGDRPAALRAYQKCREVLAREFGAQPLPETVRLAQEIDRGEVAAAVPGETKPELPLAVLRPPTLVGRGREWALMEDAWARGQWIYLRGEPGSGKTRLAADFVGSKGECITLSGRPGDTQIPFAATARNARTVLARYPDVPLQPWVRRELSRIVPELAGASGPLPSMQSQEDLLRLRQAMQVFFIERIGHLPTLLIDDWQFYDDVSNADAPYMWFTPPPAGVSGKMPHPTVTYRRGEVAPESEARILEFVAQGMAVLIDLEPLPAVGLHDLMNEVGVPDDAPSRERLIRHTGGNPLFLLETVKLLIQTGQLQGGLPEQLPLPDKVWQLIEQRLALLGTSALQAARAAATLGRDFDVTLVAEVLGAPVLDVAAAWSELEAAQIMRGNGFGHDLVSEAVLQGIPTSLGPLLHRNAARALERAGASPARTAQHWLEAGNPAEAIPNLLAAERQSRARFLPEEAERYRLQRVVIEREVGAPTATGPGTTFSFRLPTVKEGFFGRDADLRALHGALGSGAPLVTLLGTGGIGKTRLALEAAHAGAGEFSDGVVFVPLAGVADAEQVLGQVARALNISDGGLGLHDSLLAFLRRRRMLLILDNFEQVLLAAPDVAALLADLPELRVLVTSRAPLRVSGERLLPLAPLPLPEPGAEVGNPGVALLVARARDVRPDFSLTADNHAALSGVVRRLDGLPLALELAAARLRVLSPSTLLARLEHALPLLSQGARDLPERQQTLRAAIAWSDDLLSAAARRLFRQLSVFPAGWTLEAAEALTDEDKRDDVLEHLSTLIDHCLVRLEDTGGENTRYAMLSTIREYAAEELAVSGEADGVRQRQAAYFIALAHRARLGLSSPAQARWVEEIEAETGNFHAVMSDLLAAGRLNDAAELGWNLSPYWWITAQMLEGRALMTALLAHPQAAALSVLGQAQAQGTLGLMQLWLHERISARDALWKSREAFQAVGDDEGDVLSSVFLVLALVQLGEGKSAHTLAEPNVNRAQRASSFARSLAYSACGFLSMAARDPDGMAQWYGRVLALAEPVDDHLNALHGHAVIAVAQILGGAHLSAARQLAQAYRHAHAIGYKNGLAMVMEGYTLIHVQRQNLPIVAQLFGASEALRETINTPGWDEGPLPPDQTRSLLMAALGEVEFESLRVQGRQLSVAEAVALARVDLEDQPELAAVVLP
ncbi:hypothetical protein E7T06_04990 [Deinococcus sp. Arct2-2]|uniref:BTAD domain-containing putative transcriptional regulator n=1 Tax=Deinococcus sp. Arct2-2 TaxID=2568653 RepID=UPI0010A47D08|nr:BTAD domain-containing putative transcriptional regulator [Deinococcus sp. Arct2-2]THF70918.1 hypothetical protein E7T06_04990 [Deinococcus sp. Arct2-2]